MLQFIQFWLLTIVCTSLFAQHYIREGQLLVQLEHDATIEQVITAFDAFDYHQKREVSTYMNIWLLEFNEQLHDRNRLLELVKASKWVKEAQFNHILEYRATPNDANFADQWQHINTGANGGVVDADMDTDSAWNITTGGVTSLGDTIVVCVVDDGADMDHPDLVDNLWVNHNEIQGNGIDDDLNGYIDDYLGWNSYDNDDDVDGGFHGASVAGIIGAKGNNNIGVAGVNWNVKLMIVAGGPDEAEAIAAYTYPLTQRRLYNQSNGTEGAFVVATNSSWGINRGDPTGSPLWCAMYDSMGQQGILSVGATANINVNVDVEGDLPTGCSSNFLISVTNTNRTDTKVTGSGYGLTAIDLGAPGDGSYTVEDGGGYSTFGGTSASAPQVAGAIGLLYAAPCPQLMLTAKSDPELVASIIKQFIMNGVDPNASMNGISVTGGRLNIHGAMQQLLQFTCTPTGCPAPFTLLTSNVTDTSATLSWNALPSAQSFILQYRAIGDTNWVTQATNAFSEPITGLAACSEYEFRVQAICDTSSSTYSFTQTFSTDGCCAAPTGLTILSITDTSATVSWDEVLAANNYIIRLNFTDWSLDLTTNGPPPFTILGLGPCEYQSVQINSVCDTGSTTFSSRVGFTTSGCGACLDTEYCTSKADDASEEWIANVTLKDINNNTLSDDGYGDYRNFSTQLMVDSVYTISMSPGFGQFGAFDEYFKAWIDFNQDGDLEDADELIFDAGSPDSTTVSGTFTVPNNVIEGSTRLRVSMLFNEEPFACDTLDFGEVEDYCVELLRYPVSVYENINNSEVKIYPNPFAETFTVSLPQWNETTTELTVFNLEGKVVYQSSTSSNMVSIPAHFWNQGIYHLQIISPQRVITRKLIKH